MRGYARVFPIGRPYLHRYAGWLEALNGRTASAARRFAQSLAEAERLKMPIEAALARYEMGRHLPSSDPARREHLLQAQTAFQELGMSYWLARADAALSMLTDT